MFKCKECGCEYKEKPDFCDCGNDEFEEIEETEVVSQKVTEKATPKDFTIKSAQPMLKSVVEPYAIAIFVFCIILSILVLFIIGNPKTQQKQTVEREVVNTQNPSIDKIWDSSTVGIEKYNPQNEILPVKQQVKEVVEKAPTSKTTKTTLKKEPTKNIQKPSIVTKTPKTEDKKISTPAPVQAKTVASQKSSTPKQTVTNVQELNNYKVQLRNRIASKIDFTQVIGDGNCTVSFAINSEGALVNRKFLKQSDNDTLNDVVFNAMLATPSFSKPPAGYNGDVLKLGVKIYSGQFEVSLN